jgi:hypothetical protein
LFRARQTGGDVESLLALEDQHILRVSAKQKELGFEIFTDGELRRRNFMSDFTDAVEGFDFADAVARSWSAGGTGAAPVSSVTGIVTRELRQVRPFTGHELPFLKAHSPGAIVSQLTQVGLIDEFHIVVNPVILGKGSAMFEGIKRKVKLKLAKSRTFAIHYV